MFAVGRQREIGSWVRGVARTPSYVHLSSPSPRSVIVIVQEWFIDAISVLMIGPGKA